MAVSIDSLCTTIFPQSARFDLAKKGRQVRGGGLVASADNLFVTDFVFLLFFVFPPVQGLPQLGCSAAQQGDTLFIITRENHQFLARKPYRLRCLKCSTLLFCSYAAVVVQRVGLLIGLNTAWA